MSKKVGLRDALSIGIGGMVGGGIFAVLGLAVSMARGGTPLAFLFAGLLALITAYSYTKLSLAFPDRGGTVKFINQGFGQSVFSGGINNLLWVSYIIMLALYATAFGSYAPNLLQLTGHKTLDSHLYLSAIIVLATFINYYSITFVGKIESFAVVIKLLILLAFVAIGLYGLSVSPHLDQLAPRHWEGTLQLITSGMVTFVAYEGFELIANSVPDLENPEHNVPRAYFYSVGFVVLLYIIIAAVTVGSLPFDQIAKAEDYVLAEAAKPMVGQVGFTIITIAALLSTFSAINASLYGGSRVSYEIAEEDELPYELTRQLWNQPIGLLLTAALTLLMANTLKLESISIAGSVGFLLIFATVNFTGYKLSARIQANRTLPLIGSILCVLAMLVLLVQQFSSNRLGDLVAVFIIAACFAGEYVYQKRDHHT